MGLSTWNCVEKNAGYSMFFSIFTKIVAGAKDGIIGIFLYKFAEHGRINGSKNKRDFRV